MAKTRTVSQNKEAKKVKKDSKPTTPSKIMNGKVRKKNVNSKIIINKSNEDLKTNSGTEIKCSRLRVRIKRINNSNVGNKVGSLLAECEETGKKHIPVNIDKITIEERKTNIEYANKSSSEKISKTCSSQETTDKPVLISNVSTKTQNKRFNDKSEAKRERLFDDQSHLNTKNFSVRIKTVPLAKRSTKIPEKSQTCKTRKCLVRLPKIPDVAPTVKANAIDWSFSTSDYSVYSNVPVIDNVKRNNFRKLSLSKSSMFLDNDKSVKNAKETEEGVDLIDKNVQISDTASLCREESKCTQKPFMKNCSTIKQIAKLSLKRKATTSETVARNKLQDSNFEQQLNSTILFNPVRNSTILELDKTKNKEECPKQESKLNSSPKNIASTQNLAKRSDEIESLLNSLDDEEEILLKAPEKTKETSCEQIHDKNEKSQINIPKNDTTSNRFFHHKNDKAANFKEPPQQSRRESKKRRSTKGKRDNIYEFLSQSQTSDSDTVKHVDPSADVVKKLIAEGKVRVATNCKGKGKPKFKNLRIPMKQTVKRKPIAGKKLNQVKNKTKKVAFVENKESRSFEEDNGMDHFDNDYFEGIQDNDDQPFNYDHKMQSQKRETSKSTNSANIHKVLNEQKGTFSNLAKKVLMNQTGRSNTKTKTQEELLNAVRNIISTPKNKKMPLPHTALGSDLSPIVMATFRRLPPASPWRVNEDAYLPRTFNFSTSSANLPSYSSDIIIPSTPRKEKPKMSPKCFDQIDITSDKSLSMPRTNIVDAVFNSDQSVINHKNANKDGQPDNEVKSRAATTTTTTDVLQTPNSRNSTSHRRPILNEPSIISSFSSNDSNAENMPPPRRAQQNQNENENENIFNLKQLPNPRRALKHRSPLKTINILEVVQLPPYKHINKNVNPNGSEQREFGIEENVYKSIQEDDNIVTLNAKQQNIASKKDLPKEDLFGFEDFLSQTDSSSQENVKFPEEKSKNEHNQTIHDKLQELRKLKPAENEPQNYIEQRPKQQIRNMPIFDDYGGNMIEKRQRGIKEMLCSTMLDTRPSTSKEALQKLNKSMSQNKKRQNFGKDLDISELFADLEPETTFNESEAHRTYTSIRPQKRKRRLKEKNFVMYLESDESEDENNSTEKQKQHSRESDKSNKEATPKKKRHRQEPKENPELTKFIQEFNDMCREVETHELHIEKNI